MQRQTSPDRPSSIDRFRRFLLLICGVAAVYAVFSLWQLYVAATSDVTRQAAKSGEISDQSTAEVDYRNGTWTFAGFAWELVVLNAKFDSLSDNDEPLDYSQGRSPTPLSPEQSEIFQKLRPFANRDMAVGSSGLRALGFSHGDTELLVLVTPPQSDASPVIWHLHGVLFQVGESSTDATQTIRRFVFRPATANQATNIASLFPDSARATSLAKRSTLDGVPLLEIAITNGEFGWLQPIMTGGPTPIPGFEPLGSLNVNGYQVEYFQLPHVGEKLVLASLRLPPTEVNLAGDNPDDAN